MTADRPSLLGRLPSPRHLARSALAAALTPVRRGNRIMEIPRPELRFGNLLYIWMHAWIDQQHGGRSRVLTTPAAVEWYPELPSIRSALTLDRDALRFTDQRRSGTYQGFGEHFTAEQLAGFCREHLIDSPLDRRAREHPDPPPVTARDCVTVNVRRGDYYSVPEYRERYGIDVERYVAEALAAQRRHGEIRRVHLVSDDVDWCRTHLDLGGLEVTWAAKPGPALDFSTLANASRLVLTNSTFSYWGGYIAQVRDPGAVVVAPLFHARDWLGGRSFQLHPDWEALPGFGEEDPAPEG